MGVSRRERRGDYPLGCYREEGAFNRLTTAPSIQDVVNRYWPNIDFVDTITYNEGEFIGYHLGVPYDWETMSPELREGD